jgi:hypothetical protein
MSEEEVEIIRKGLDAFNRGDRETFGHLLALEAAGLEE